MPRISRTEILNRLRAKINAGRPIIGGGAGTGLSARCEEGGWGRSDRDLQLGPLPDGRSRVFGGLAGLWQCEEIVVDMAREVLPVVRGTPVLAGVNGTDPFMLRDKFLDDLITLGFSGVQNFPTVGLIDGAFRANLEETGMGYGHEVDLIAAAQSKDMLTTPYVFNPDDATAMAGAGADILVPHMGLTTGGNIGAGTALKLADCPPLIDAMAEAARKVNPDVIVLCHGGPISSPEDAAYILRECPGVQGFYGASSMERLPSETALSDQMRAFVNIGKD